MRKRGASCNLMGISVSEYVEFMQRESSRRLRERHRMAKGGVVGALLTGVFARPEYGGTAGLLAGNPEGLTTTRARGHGGELEQVETYRGTTVKMELVDKVRLDIGVSEPFVEPTIAAITGAARTGEVGDGKIFVVPVERVVRIRTGEADEAAVTPETVPA